LHRYFWLVDHGRAAETVELFSPTARLTFGPGAPKPGSLCGAEIGAAMQARQKQTHVNTRHVISNVVMAARQAGLVEVTSLLTLFKSEHDSRDSYPASIADINDVFVLQQGAWLIQERTILPVFSRAQAG
jgi:hypothetical protein